MYTLSPHVTVKDDLWFVTQLSCFAEHPVFFIMFISAGSFKSLMVLFNGKLSIDNHFLLSTLPVLSACCFHPAVLSMWSPQFFNLGEKWSKDKTEITFLAFIFGLYPVFTQCLPPAGNLKVLQGINILLIPQPLPWCVKIYLKRLD